MPITPLLLKEIMRNDVKILRLSNDPDEYFDRTDDFVNAMEYNTSIEKVIFDNDFLACCNGSTRKVIVSACGKLQNVQSVVLKDSVLMIGECITSLVTNATKLEELTMENCTLRGLVDDFQRFEDALKRNTSLKTLRINNCKIANGTIALTEVINGYKSLPSMAVEVL